MEKRIITISREYGAGGLPVGRMVAEKLGIPFYDKKLVEHVAEESGFAPKFIEEHGEHSPSGSMFSYAFAPQGVPGVMNGLSTSDYLWNVQCNVILQLAEKGPCVIVGRCASELLKGSNVLSVFIYADEQDCAARVMQRNQLNEHEAAKRIKHVDRMRKKYFACYADSEWGQPESYDLMLSSSKFGIDGCVELILGSLAQMKGEASVE